MWLYFRLFLFALRLLRRDRRDLVLENLALRQQLAVFERDGRRPARVRADRRFWLRLAQGWQPWRRHRVVVQPDTVVRWNRTAWRIHWRCKSRVPHRGRPRHSPAVIALIQRIRREDPTWGTRRIEGELHQRGLSVGRSTIQRYGPRPAPSPSWRTFLRLHAAEIWACDFFTVQTLTFRTLHVFFVIAHDRRTLLYWNVTRHPTAAWVWQQIREATPWGQQPRFLIRDRDGKFGGDFVPRRAPDRNRDDPHPVSRAPSKRDRRARCWHTARECLDHVIVRNERHLRRMLREYVDFYNGARPHQALAQAPPAGDREHGGSGARVVGEPVLGGLHHVYRWAA